MTVPFSLNVGLLTLMRCLCMEYTGAVSQLEQCLPFNISKEGREES